MASSDLPKNALNVYSEISGFLDLATDLILLRSAVHICMRLDADAVCGGTLTASAAANATAAAAAAGCSGDGDNYGHYVLVCMLLLFSILAPFLIAYSSGLQLLLHSGSLSLSRTLPRLRKLILAPPNKPRYHKHQVKS